MGVGCPERVTFFPLIEEDRSLIREGNGVGRRRGISRAAEVRLDGDVGRGEGTLRLA
jgi:hypothetical protein